MTDKMSKCYHCIHWGKRCDTQYPLDTYDICEDYKRIEGEELKAFEEAWKIVE